MATPPLSDLAQALETREAFADRHIGPDGQQAAAMLRELGYASLEALVAEAVPGAITLRRPLDLPSAATEHEALAELRGVAAQNRVLRSFIGMGYSDCITPPVIQRNVLENPGWYTQYTPYQAEIAQGRLEALLNFQTMVTDLTAMEIANASLLDEGTAAAEAMTLCLASARNESHQFFIAEDCHPQTIEVVRTRAVPLGIEVVVGSVSAIDWQRGYFGILLQYPGTDGTVVDYRALIERAKQEKALVVMAADILALALLKPPGELGADVAVGSTQRFGVPLGYGGPHAAYFATRLEFQRRLPGRLVGVSKSRDGRPAYRLTLQTREQHIRRDKATSNICTAQVLLAVMSSLYAVYHGPKGILAIARRTHALAVLLAAGLKRLGFTVENGAYFDTVRVKVGDAQTALLRRAVERGMNLRALGATAIGIALDETTDVAAVTELWRVFAPSGSPGFVPADLKAELRSPIPEGLQRQSAYLSHPVFNRHHSETQMLRYLHELESRDLSLTHSMIPLGSCTMKLNATAELFPVTWPEFGRLHPFAPADQTTGYRRLFSDLERWLAEITGFSGVSLQPNSGAQGEYAGLLVIRQYLRSLGQGQRDVCLIPKSAHGTNPASAALCGMKVVAVECDDQGNIDLADLAAKAQAHQDRLAALMITYPSTHGVFEANIRQFCELVHRAGGQVYLDGANLNAQVGVCRPGDYGADVCHLNLHKTFCIPHGGGGPGMGPIAVKAHLAPFLPGHPVVAVGGERASGPVSAAPWGSASILPISWMYIRMMGAAGLLRATQVAILNANYIARRLQPHYPVLYRGNQGLVAHECIVDLRGLKKEADIEVDDVAKRLMDYGFHAPTISWPVAGTMMIEPTESESRDELDRFCDAMIAIREEVRAIASGKFPREDNPLKNAPHTAREIAGEWKHAYPRELAAFASPAVAQHKFWPAVSRIDNVWGDRNLFCSCPPME
jgi:glycine dehydrogenase